MLLHSVMFKKSFSALNNIELARARQAERPDIHTEIIAPTHRQYHGDNVVRILRDLRENVPAISLRDLSKVTKVGRKVIAALLVETTVAVPEWSSDNNEKDSAEHLSVLQACHPNSLYRDEPMAVHESKVSHFIHVADFSSPHDAASRKADQTHTRGRPITLATVPFNWRD